MNLEEIKNIILKNKSTIKIVLPKDKLFDYKKAKGRKVDKYNKNRTNKLINIKDIHEDLYKIEESEYDYITTTGNVYIYYGDNMFYKRRCFVNKHNGYVYTAISITNKNVQRRLHILLAKTFIPNPYDKYLKIVGHKNDDKKDYSLENLYWTNNQENTKDASEKGFSEQSKAENNKKSIYVKVLDKDTYKIVGVYGSISECARCIENMSKSSISKMCKVEKPYKPRSRKYIYQVATKKEFEQNSHLNGVKLIESTPVNKTPKVFLLCNDNIGYKQEFDNQVQASKACGISQAMLSHMIREGNSNDGWYCVYKDTIKYTDASSYKNLLDAQEAVIIKNIYTNEQRRFETSESLKDYFKLNGNDIRHYYKTGHTLMSEWKVVGFEQKNSFK